MRRIAFAAALATGIVALGTGHALQVARAASADTGPAVVEAAPTDHSIAIAKETLAAHLKDMDAKRLATLRLIEGGKYNVNLRRLAAAEAGTEFPNTAQLWFVLEGTGTLSVGGVLDAGAIKGARTHPLGPGDVVYLPSGLPHAVSHVGRKLSWLAVRWDTDWPTDSPLGAGTLTGLTGGAPPPRAAAAPPPRVPLPAGSQQALPFSYGGSGERVFTAKAMDEIMAGMRLRKSGNTRLIEGGRYNINLRWNGTPSMETHAQTIDTWVLLAGGGTVNTGFQTADGARVPGTGVSAPAKPGDVFFMPSKLPHGYSEVRPDVFWLNIRWDDNYRKETSAAQPEKRYPVFEVDPTWPKLPNGWVLGHVAGVATDRHDHVWLLHRPRVVPEAQRSRAAPPVLEFDQNGRFVNAWGGPGEGYDWPDSEHGIVVDYKDRVWIGGSAPIAPSLRELDDDMLLKFDNKGKFLLQVGGRNTSKGNADGASVHQPADVYVWPKTNEAFIADGYGNRRVLVLDADTGRFKRMWGAFGNTPIDAPLAPRGPPATPATLDVEGRGAEQFGSPVHAIKVSDDGLVYAADRPNRRVQVFTPEGKYVDQVFINRAGPSPQSAAGIALSPDREQRFLYVADYGNSHVAVVDRKSLQVLYQFGQRSEKPGDFQGLHQIAIDSKGNLYTGEVAPGARAQRFVFKGYSDSLPANAFVAAATAAPAPAPPPAPTGPPQTRLSTTTMENPYRLVPAWPRLGDIKAGAAIGIVPDDAGGVWLQHRSVPGIVHLNAAGDIVKRFDVAFSSSHGMCRDRDGNFWAVDGGTFVDSADTGVRGNQVFKYSPDGKLLLTLGKAGVGKAGPDTFLNPSACASTPEGDIVIADGHWPRPTSMQQDGDRLVWFTRDGKFIKEFGRHGSKPGEFMGPHGLAFDSQGRLFVADRSNNRLQIFDKAMKFVDEWRHFGRPSGVVILKDDTLIVGDSESGWGIGGPPDAPEGGGNAIRNPGWQNGIRIGNARTGALYRFIPNTRPEGLGADENGTVYSGLTGGCDTSPSGGCLQKYVTATPPALASDITAAQVQAIINAPTGGGDRQMRVVDMGKYNVSVGVLRRGKTKAGEPVTAINHAHVTEVYYVVSGSGTLLTGGTVDDIKPLAPDSEVVKVAVGASNIGVFRQAAQTRKVGPGDIVIIPPGVFHGFTDVADHVDYVSVRPDPDHVLPAGYVHPLITPQEIK